MSVLGWPLLQLRHIALPSTRTTTALHSSFRHPFFSSSKLTLSAEPLSRLNGERRVAGPVAFSLVGVLRSASGFVSGLGFWLKTRWSREREHQKNELEHLISNLEIEQLRLKQRIADEKRREALSKILDIKGSIRVFCRIRSYLLAEKIRIYEPVSAMSERIRVKLGGIRKDFEFDKVFPQEASQESVFVEVEPILGSGMDGHNVCVFAYCQTGTGKTFTMDGTKQPGIIPRALEELFRQASMDNSSGRSYEPMTKWLQDVVHSEKRLYLVFEYLDLDLKKHMDSSPEFVKDLRQVKIFEIMDFSTPTSYGSKA